MRVASKLLCRERSSQCHYSREELAKEIMLYTSKLLGEKLRKVNELNIDFKEKSRLLVKSFIETALEESELINYFLKVYFGKQRSV